MIFKDNITRSQFFRAIGSAAMVCTLPSTVFANRSMAIERLHASTFEPLVKSHFRIGTSEISFSAQLVSVKQKNVRFSDRLGEKQLEAFSLLFKSNPENEFESGVHELSHPTLGTFPLFLSPTQVNGNKGYCEIVINRLNDSQ